MVRNKIFFIILVSFTLIASTLVFFRIDKNGSIINKNGNNGQLFNGTVINGRIYEIAKKTYTSAGIKITYPQITGLKDIEKQKTINRLIKNEALKVLNFYTGIDNGFTLEINFDIPRKSKNLLSIRYSGIGYATGAAHPNNQFYTTNINMNSGSRLRLKDLVIIDEKMVHHLKSGKLKALKPEHNGLLNDFTNRELVDKLNKADSLDNIGESGIFSYFTKDSLGLSFSVGHAAGDHAEFEIKYQEIMPLLKPRIYSMFKIKS